jgi:hypothetical protein
VQAVGPDHQVETPPGTAREDHVDPVSLLGQLGDPVAEDVLGGGTGVVVEQPGQVPAQDLDIRDEPVAAVVLGTEGLQHLPAGVHGVRAGGVRARRADHRVQPHTSDDLPRDPPRVHRLSPRTQPGSPLHHRHLGTEPGQPVGQRRTRDARPRHQHPRTAGPRPLPARPDRAFLPGVLDAHHCLHAFPPAPEPSQRQPTPAVDPTGSTARRYETHRCGRNHVRPATRAPHAPANTAARGDGSRSPTSR